MTALITQDERIMLLLQDHKRRMSALKELTTACDQYYFLPYLLPSLGFRVVNDHIHWCFQLNSTQELHARIRHNDLYSPQYVREITHDFVEILNYFYQVPEHGKEFECKHVKRDFNVDKFVFLLTKSIELNPDLDSHVLVEVELDTDLNSMFHSELISSFEDLYLYTNTGQKIMSGMSQYSYPYPVSLRTSPMIVKAPEDYYTKTSHIASSYDNSETCAVKWTRVSKNSSLGNLFRLSNPEFWAPSCLYTSEQLEQLVTIFPLVTSKFFNSLDQSSLFSQAIIGQNDQSFFHRLDKETHK